MNMCLLPKGLTFTGSNFKFISGTFKLAKKKKRNGCQFLSVYIVEGL